jgi:phosphoserine phosphatase
MSSESIMHQPVLCIDLDGTLIYEDTLNQALLLYLQKNPFRIVRILSWLLKGRAWLKHQLFQRVTLDVTRLSYNQALIEWIKSEKATGRKTVLVTATDMKMAQAVFQYLPIFDEVLASDGVINLRSENKAAALNTRYGRKNYTYAGNSSADLPVWAEAQDAVVVNASEALLQKARQLATVTRVF